jgi:hypothetical protein
VDGCHGNKLGKGGQRVAIEMVQVRENGKK